MCHISWHQNGHLGNGTAFATGQVAMSEVKSGSVVSTQELPKGRVRGVDWSSEPRL